MPPALAAKPAEPPRPVTLRAVLIGAALIPLCAWWLAQIEYVRYSDNATTSALFFHCIALLLGLIGLNALWLRFAPASALRRGEILTIYSMTVVGSGLIGHDQLHILFTTLAWPIHNATPENRWAAELWPCIPQHLVPRDTYALDRLFGGGSSLYAPGIWRVWVGPLGWWAVFAAALVWTLFCLVTIFRRQWDAERLNYPVAGVPLEVTSPTTPVFRSSLFWVAFSLAATIQFVRLVHNLYPAFPRSTSA
jgi:hypothetical protein